METSCLVCGMLVDRGYVGGCGSRCSDVRDFCVPRFSLSLWRSTRARSVRLRPSQRAIQDASAFSVRPSCYCRGLSHRSLHPATARPERSGIQLIGDGQQFAYRAMLEEHLSCVGFAEAGCFALLAWSLVSGRYLPGVGGDGKKACLAICSNCTGRRQSDHHAEVLRSPASVLRCRQS